MTLGGGRRVETFGFWYQTVDSLTGRGAGSDLAGSVSISM
jgi:hypothetical protein